MFMSRITLKAYVASCHTKNAAKRRKNSSVNPENLSYPLVVIVVSCDYYYSPRYTMGHHHIRKPSGFLRSYA